MARKLGRLDHTPSSSGIRLRVCKQVNPLLPLKVQEEWCVLVIVGLRDVEIGVDRDRRDVDNHVPHTNEVVYGDGEVRVELPNEFWCRSHLDVGEFLPMMAHNLLLHISAPVVGSERLLG